MSTDATRSWGLWMLRGVLAMVFGALAFLLPFSAITALILLFGAYVFIDGIFAIAAAFHARAHHTRWWSLLIEGILNIAFGIIAFIWPSITAIALMWIVAGWAIATGIFAIVAAIHLHRGGDWLFALGGVASIALGVALFAYPAAGLLLWVWMLGAYALLFGVLLFAFGWRLHSLLLGGHHGHSGLPAT